MSQTDISAIEKQVEANVQKSLETLDAWRLTEPLQRNTQGAKCQKDAIKCDLKEQKVCVGCEFYRCLTTGEASFDVGGRSDVCELIAHMSDYISFGFIQDGKWLNPAATLTGNWFVRHPVRFVEHRRGALTPKTRVSIQRNKVKFYRADEILAKIGATDELYKELRICWKISPTCTIFSFDEFLDYLKPFVDCATAMKHLHIQDANILNIISAIRDL